MNGAEVAVSQSVLVTVSVYVPAGALNDGVVATTSFAALRHAYVDAVIDDDSSVVAPGQTLV